MNKFKKRILENQAELNRIYDRGIEKFGGITVWESRSGRSKGRGKGDNKSNE